MTEYITTYTGIHFCPTRPDSSKIYIEDIAHSLSLLCRGNGHVQTFFSVGRHCINCAVEARARGYSDRLVLACLLHDASEAYMSDVPRPFKQYLTEYINMENKLLDVIYQKYLGSTLDREEWKLIGRIDDEMLYYDLELLLNEKQDGDPPKLFSKPVYESADFAAVENEYLKIFKELYVS